MGHTLIQILLPLTDSQGEPWPSELHEQVKIKFTQEFGGMTAYVYSPAEGRWKDGGAQVEEDMVMYEVVTESLDTEWWAQYRTVLMSRFQQQDLMIRALPMQHL